jgi:hypothetical protein
VTNTYSGGTVLKAGILMVHSAQALGVGNVMVNGGTLNADPRQINVGGNYTQTAGGTLQLQVAGANPGVSGRFGQFIDPFATGPGFNTVLLLYGRDSVILEFLNADLGVPGAPVLPVATSLAEISPEGLTAFYEISFSNANIQRLNLESRLDDLRSGSNGFSSNMKLNGATLPPGNKTAADGKSSKGVVEPILQPGPENRWGVWVTGFGDFVSVDSDANVKGYDFTTGGVSLGIDYRITDQLANSGVRRDALLTSEAGRHLGKVSKASRLTLGLEAGREEDGLLTSFGSQARRLTYFGGRTPFRQSK